MQVKRQKSLTDVDALNNKILAEGISNVFIANKLGISEPSWIHKKKGRRSFTQWEIQTLCDILHITKLTDKERIFFSKGVD